MSDSDVTLDNPVDTWVNQDADTRNYSDGRSLGVKTSSGHNAYALLHFNRPFDLGATIVSAKLRLKTKGSWGTTPTVSVKRVSSRWTASRAVYGTLPSVAGSAGSHSQSSAADGDLWEIDVTALMQDVSDGGAYYGLRVESNSSSLKYFYSGNDADHTPELFVEWSDQPQAPTTLSPSGGRAVSASKPVLRFDFTDDAGSTALANVQVQVHTSNVWTSPAFDSGTVSAEVPELDLAATAFSGITAGQVKWWRVRVQDGAGLWSDWSDGVSFTRTAKPTFTVTSPSAGVVDEWTPEITWSALSALAQTAWRLMLADADGDVVYDTGRNSGTDTGHTLPKGVIEDGSEYALTIRLWDTADREATPGDPVWLEQSTAFTFDEDVTTDPVDSLDLVDLSPLPYMRLDFARSVGPDGFNVVRDGKVVESDIDPADVDTGGGTYSYTDKQAGPRSAHTWKVQAVVNHKTSAGNPEATGQTHPSGLWVVDRDGGLEVFVADTDESTWPMGETGETFAPVSGTRSIRVTQSVRGWEGHVNGLLIDTDSPSRTAAQWKERYLSVKGRPGRVVGIVVGHSAFDCVLFNMAVTPTNRPLNTYAVSFDFFQVGRLDFAVHDTGPSS